MILNGSAVLMTYLFLLADQIFLNNPKSFKIDISRTLLDLYTQE